MDRLQKSTKLFMEKAKQQVRAKPEIPSDQEIVRCLKLVAEEAFLELTGACGYVAVATEGAGTMAVPKDIAFVQVDDVDMVQVADALADAMYVLSCCANAFGIDLEPILDEVCHNNLSKFGEGHSFDENGKLIKPDGYQGPNIAMLLDQQSKPLKSQIMDTQGDGYHRFLGVKFPLVQLMHYYFNGHCMFRLLQETFPWFTEEHGEAMLEWFYDTMPEKAMAQYERFYELKKPVTIPPKP